MYNRITVLGKQSIIYGIGGVLNQFVSVLLVPIYVRYLTPEDYGIVQLLVVTSAFIVIVTQMGLATAVFKSTLYDESKNTETVYSTAFYTLAASALLSLAIGSGLTGSISQLLFGTPEYRRLVWLMFATVSLDTTIAVPKARLRVEERAAQYSVVSFASFTCRLVLNILFVVMLQRGAAGLMEANALQSLLFIPIYIWLIKDQLVLRFSKSECLNLISFGLPLIPAMISSRILSLFDRYILTSYSDLTTVGLYSLGYRIATVVSLVVSAFQTAWPAVFFPAGRAKDAKRFYARVLTYFVFLSGYLALGLSVLAEDTLEILASPAFYPAYRVVPLLSLSYVFYGAYFVAAVGIQLEKKTNYLAYVAGSAAALQIGLNLLLVPSMGMMGAALNTAISYLAMPIMIVLISRRFYPIRYEYQRLCVMAIVAALLYFLSRLIDVEQSVVSFGLRGLVALSFPLVLGLFRFYTDEERERIGYLFRRGWVQVSGLRKRALEAMNITSKRKSL